MRVLFIGNSHTYYNEMPHIVQQLMEAAGQPIEITMLSKGGAHLADHIANEQTKFNILYGHYDFVVLQEVTLGFPGAKVYLESVQTIKNWCDEAGSKCGLYMNFADANDDPPQEMLKNVVSAIGDHLGLPVARAGEAFQRAKQFLSDIELYWEDNRHAGYNGSYLIALTIVHDFFGVEPKGLPALGCKKDEYAEALQRLVHAL